MTKGTVWAAFVAIIGAALVAFAIIRSDDPSWPIATGMVGLLALGVLLGIY